MALINIDVVSIAERMMILKNMYLIVVTLFL